MAFAFLKADFHPCTVHPFIIQMVENILIRKNPAIFPNLLLAHLELGSSVDGLILIQRGDPGICEITWVNRLYKPAGTNAPPSCPNCFAVKPWTVQQPDHHSNFKEPEWPLHPQTGKKVHPGECQSDFFSLN